MLLDAFNERVSGVARDGNCVGAGALQSLAGRIHGHRRVGFILQQIGRAIRNLRVLLHHHLDMVLIPACRRAGNDLAHEINRSCRANTTHDAQPERQFTGLACALSRKRGVEVVDIQCGDATALQVGTHQRKLGHARHDKGGPLRVH
ncbi:hypothetical protein D3C81_1192840 [compost metagenome]